MSKKEWGNATWYLFHTLAEKLKPEFNDNVLELYSQIVQICANLPCPDCLTHAMKALNSVNSKNIKTREDLIKIIWQFHNNVNIRINKQTITFEECSELYKRANLRNVVNNFLHVMNKRYGTKRAMLYSLHRNKCITKFTDYIKTNCNKFNC